MRLLQVCGVNRFGHILSAVPPEAATIFAQQQDFAITKALAAIQGFPVDSSTSTHDLSVVAGGAGLPPLQRTASASYLGAFFRVVGPLIHRLVQMRGPTTSRVDALLEDPETSKVLGHDWAINISSAHQEVVALQASFTLPELHTLCLVAPRGNTITSAGDTASVATDLSPP